MSTPFLRDILSQGDALRELAAHADELAEAAGSLAPRATGRIVLTGMGASHHATYPAYLRLAAAGRPVWHVETSELVHHLDGLVSPGTLLVCTSQSGRSAEVLALLERLAGEDRRPHVVAVVNDVTSPLARAAGTVVPLHAGPEHAVGTRTFSNAVVAAAWVADGLLGEAPEPDAVVAAGERIDAWLADVDGHLSTLAALVPLPRSLVLVGRGPSLGIARGGALVIKEAAKVHAEAMSGGQFRHGPIELAEPAVAVVVLAGPAGTVPLARRLAEDVAAAGATTCWLGAASPPPGLPALPLPERVPGAAEELPSTIALQLLAHALGEARGLVPGEFRHASKVTAIL